MDLTSIAALAVKLAQAITFLTGDWEASSILALVAKFLKDLDFSAVSSFIAGILPVIGG